MALWTELGKALGDLALLSFKAAENLPANKFYKNRIQKLEKDGAAIHGRVSKIDEARSRVPPRNATPTEHYMHVNNVTREIQLFCGSITALQQHMDIDIRVQQEREQVMGGNVTVREVDRDRAQEPTQVLATAGGNVMEAFRGSNSQRLLQSPALSTSTEVTPAPAARVRGLLLNNKISMGLVTPTPTNNQNSSLSVNTGRTPVVRRRRIRIDTSSDEDDETVFGSPSPSPCLCSSCSQNVSSPASTRNNVSSPEPETLSSRYSSHSVCENCGAPRDESFGFSLNSPNSTITNCSSLSPASSLLSSPCLCPNCAPHLHLTRRLNLRRNW